MLITLAQSICSIVSKSENVILPITDPSGDMHSRTLMVVEGTKCSFSARPCSYNSDARNYIDTYKLQQYYGITMDAIFCILDPVWLHVLPAYCWSSESCGRFLVYMLRFIPCITIQSVAFPLQRGSLLAPETAIIISHASMPLDRPPLSLSLSVCLL